MKLAEALQERADLNQKIQRVQQRLLNNATIQEGEKPAEDPKALRDILDSCIERLEELIRRINVTNCEVELDGMKITEMIAKKDALLLKASIYRNLANEANRLSDRVRGSEIKIIPTIPVWELQEEADKISKEIRMLDNRIQENNWKIELL